MAVTVAVVTQYHHAGPTEGPKAKAGALGCVSSVIGASAVNDGGPAPVAAAATAAPADGIIHAAPATRTPTASPRSSTTNAASR